MISPVLVYVLLFPTILNTILLAFMAIIFCQMLKLAADLSYKTGLFMEYGEKEVHSTAATFRQVALQLGNLIDKLLAFFANLKRVSAIQWGGHVMQNPLWLIGNLGVGLSLGKLLKR